MLTSLRSFGQMGTGKLQLNTGNLKSFWLGFTMRVQWRKPWWPMTDGVRAARVSMEDTWHVVIAIILVNAQNTQFHYEIWQNGFVTQEFSCLASGKIAWHWTKDSGLTDGMHRLKITWHRKNSSKLSSKLLRVEVCQYSVIPVNLFNRRKVNIIPMP